MEFYHFFGSMKAANLDAKITSPKSFVIALLKLLELINTWGVCEDPKQVKMPYLYVDTDKLKRAFIVKSNQIVSFAFPFAIYTKTDALGKDKLYINYWDKQLDDVIISHAMTIARTLDLKKSTYAAQAKSIDFGDPTKVIAAKVFEVALALEPSYVRYDYDAKACNGIIHPLHHLDVNYSSDYTYKIGLYGELQRDSITTIISNEEKCWYVDCYSKFMKTSHMVKAWLNRRVSRMMR